MKSATDKAIEYLQDRNVEIPIDILIHRIHNLNVEQMKKVIQYHKEQKQGTDYGSIRATLWADVYDNVYNYLTSSRNVTTYRQTLSVALSAAYINSSEQAWIDGGADLPLDDETLSWSKAELNAQLSYIDSLFETMKQLRKEGDFDALSEAFRRADGYTTALDGFYNYIKTAAFGGKMLTFVGSDGRESCHDCKRLKNQRKRASWWVSHELVPPSRMFECKGYNCDHYLIDDKGNVFTV